MKRIEYFIAAIIIILGFNACEESETGKGTINLAITDAPVDQENVSGVYITVTGIQYHTEAEGWLTFEEFEGPQIFNLLDLTRGETDMLGSFELSGGKYTQIRFMLDAPEKGQGTPSNPGCYIEFTDGSTQPLFVPSGSESGFKGVGAFTVPVNGSVNVTADFDVRKSVVKTGNQEHYILKPVIRLVVDNQAGAIAGNVSNAPEDATVVVYAYEDGTYTENETIRETEESPLFPNAVSSDIVCELNKYHIAFLAAGTYDLVVTTTVGEEDPQVAAIIEDVVVESNATTTYDIDFSNLQ
jgi:hypothetical protein